MNKWLFVALLLAAGSADAAVHRCKAPDGKVTYTDRGCPQGQDVGGRDREADEGSHADAANARRTDGGGGGYYREQIKSAEQTAPKSEPPRP